MLLGLQNNLAPIQGDLHRIIQGRQLIGGKLDVHHGADNLNYFAFGHFHFTPYIM
jgi:hypothetical protein